MRKFELHTNELVIGYEKNNQTVFSTCLPELSFKSGELIAIVGENGCGKSTFLKTLLNIVHPISGQIFIDEFNLNTLDSKEIAKQISVVLTEKLPPSNLTAKEIISLGRLPHTAWHGYFDEIDEEKVNEVIANLDLKSLINKNHDELSDGQLQRVLIARALTQDTPFIFLDEPTTYLDLAHQFQLMNLLKKLAHQTNKCIVFSTHAIELAIDYCDYMLTFTSEGNFYNTPKELIKDNVFDMIFNNMSLKYDKVKNKFQLTNEF